MPKLLGLVAALVVLGLSPARADIFIVDGIFQARAGIPANTLSGTINVTGGQITSVDLIVPGFASHFTHIGDNQGSIGSWILSATNNNQFISGPNGRDYLLLNFLTLPGPYLLGFQMGNINGGSVSNQTYNPITTASITTYYGLGLRGTICPVAGCDTVSIPSPIAGAGLPGLLIIAAFLCSAFYQRSKNQ